MQQFDPAHAEVRRGSFIIVASFKWSCKAESWYYISVLLCLIVFLIAGTLFETGEIISEEHCGASKAPRGWG
jgi:hypothetical protein